MDLQQFQSCIDACNTCAEACDYCAASCLREPNVGAMARCISLDIDCAAVCRLAAGMMARGSDMSGTICQACTEICEACADECARHQTSHCQDCARAARLCADECRRIATAVPAMPRQSGIGAAVH